MQHRQRLLEGFHLKGISSEFGEALFEQIKGFGEYGFPESHASSFALLVYASSWEKCHYPAHFTCGLLNSQPMGFYQPTSLVRDAQKHGVQVRDVCIEQSDWNSTLEEPDPGKSRIKSHEPGANRALRLGLRLIKGLGEETALRIDARRKETPFSSLPDLVHRAALKKDEVEALAESGALEAIEKGRRNALWKSQAPRTPGLFTGLSTTEESVELPVLHAAEQLVLDYGRKGLSVSDHPLRHHRKKLRRLGAVRASDLLYLPKGKRVALAGLVMGRQRPATASGVVFITLEDETGAANLIVYSSVFEKYHHAARHAQMLFVTGEIERDTRIPVPQRPRHRTDKNSASSMEARATLTAQAEPTQPKEPQTPVIHIIVQHIERWGNDARPDIQWRSRDFH
jgi:error-prone DNA polymerase